MQMKKLDATQCPIPASVSVTAIERFDLYEWRDAAVAAEREACAKICDRLTMAIDCGGNSYRRPATADQCASAIRAQQK